MRKIRIIGVILVVALSMSGCGNILQLTDRQTEKDKVRVIQNEEPEEKEQMEEPDTETEQKKLLVAIDPGHQAWDVDMSAKEPNAPGSDVMKAKASSGTAGKYTGVPEYELCLDVSLQLRDALQKAGYDVIMTREDNETAISNSERAELANNAGADIAIRIHANGCEDTSVNGALALITSQANLNTSSLYGDSKELAEDVLGSYCEGTGMQNLGIQENDTMTGLNWSKVPVMILEMGFMTNEQDDCNMEDADYRNKMVNGIVNGIEQYYESHRPSDTIEMDGLSAELAGAIRDHQAQGEHWGVYVEKMVDGSYASAGDGRQEAASLIKLFVAGAVYEDLDLVTGQESYAGETEELVRSMIRVSDNNAANTLVRRLGSGDASAGMQRVNEYCAVHGYPDTHMGRLLLDFNAADDNYTSPKDCVQFLEAVEKNEIAGASQILTYMKEQDRRGKIPAGLPEGTACANKTGELEAAEHDAAIISTDKGDYAICVMGSGLNDTAAAREKIVEISGLVYQSVLN